MSRVLIDFHHADLAEAMHRLFEDRLGHTVYVVHGHDWWDAEYWRFGYGWGDDRLARQFLVALDDSGGGFHDRKLRLLTLPEFRAMDDWFAIVATVQDNQRGFAALAAEVGARYIVQAGNTNQYIDWSLDPFVLSSSEMPLIGRGLVMHQELDIDGTFGFAPFVGNDRRSIASFVNLFPVLECAPLFEAVRRLLPDWRFGIFGHNSPDGFIKPVTRSAEVMRSYAFGWHDKITGDGFGHVIHQWAAIGRPLVGHGGHYRGKLAADLWEDGVTCIDLDHHDPLATAVMLAEIAADGQRYDAMCRAIRERLDARIDYAAEAAQIAEALA